MTHCVSYTSVPDSHKKKICLVMNKKMKSGSRRRRTRSSKTKRRSKCHPSSRKRPSRKRLTSCSNRAYRASSSNQQNTNEIPLEIFDENTNEIPLKILDEIENEMEKPHHKLSPLQKHDLKEFLDDIDGHFRGFKKVIWERIYHHLQFKTSNI